MNGQYLVFSQDVPFTSGNPNWAQSTTRLRCVTDSRQHLWSRSILPGVIPSYATRDSADKYLVTGTRSDDGVTTFAFLAKVNAVGDVIWQRQYSRANREHGSRVLRAVHGYLLIGTTGVSMGDSLYTWVVRTDDSGQMIWNHKYALAPSTGCYYGVETWDGGFVLTGSSGPMGNSTQTMAAFKIDAQGQVLWSYRRVFGTALYSGSPVEMADHSLRIPLTCLNGTAPAFPVLVKLSAAGQEEWFKSYVESSFCSFAVGGIMLANGDLVLTGVKHRMAGGPSDYDLYCVRLDSEGRRLWSFVSGTTMYNEGHCVIKRSSGGYILGAMCESQSWDGHNCQAQLLYTGVDPLSPMGACCHVDATCSITTEMDCPAPSSWHGDSQACAPDPCGPPPGACCEPSGFCTLVPAQSCPETGIWQGAGTLCTPNPCLLGACCQHLVCTICSPVPCAALGGNFRGNGTLCDPNPCRALMGACCHRADLNICEIATPEHCAYNDLGIYLGNATLCEPNPCPALIAVDGGNSDVPRLQLLVAPNPSSDGVVIRCLLPMGGQATVVLFDASGRMVRRLHEGDLLAGETRFSWNGRDDAGREMSAGVYLVKVTTPVGDTSERVVLTR